MPMYIQRHGGAKVHMLTRYLVLECRTVYYKIEKKGLLFFLETVALPSTDCVKAHNKGSKCLHDSQYIALPI